MHPLTTRVFVTIIMAASFQSARAQQQIDRTLLMEYLQNQQYESAISYLQPRVAENDISQLSLLAYTYYLSGKTKDAIGRYEKVLQLDSNNVAAHQYLASICMQMESPSLAIPHYQQIIRLQPGNATAHKQIAFACFAAQQRDTAFVWLQKAYLLNPADPKVTARLGEEWIGKEQYALADSILRSFMQKDSLQPSVIMTAVRSAWFLKNYPRCTSLGTQLMDMKIVSPNTYSFVTAAWYMLKKYQQCIAVYEYLLANNAQSEDIMYYAALAYTALKNYTASNELLQSCISLATSKSLDSYYSGKSANYEGLRQYKSAIASLDTAYYLFHKPLRQYSIGRIYEVHLKNKPQATVFYKRFMKTGDPADPKEADIYKYLRAYVEK
jgi:tetratricopeptide (TPR) repeat protein